MSRARLGRQEVARPCDRDPQQEEQDAEGQPRRDEGGYGEGDEARQPGTEVRDEIEVPGSLVDEGEPSEPALVDGVGEVNRAFLGPEPPFEQDVR